MLRLRNHFIVNFIELSYFKIQASVVQCLDRELEDGDLVPVWPRNFVIVIVSG